MNIKNLGSTLLFLIFCFNLSTTLKAQDPSDCVTAIQLCDSLEFNIIYGAVQGLQEEDVSIACNLNNPQFINLEQNTIWFKYEFTSAGDFFFTLTPDSTQFIDLDFVVYTSANNDCTSLEAIRCMFSGESAGGEDNSPCVGSTGQSRSSTDVLEDIGCNGDDDNFLAAVDVNAGDVLF